MIFAIIVAVFSVFAVFAGYYVKDSEDRSRIEQPPANDAPTARYLPDGFWVEDDK